MQLLNAFEGNRWSVGPKDELLPETEGRMTKAWRIKYRLLLLDKILSFVYLYVVFIVKVQS